MQEGTFCYWTKWWRLSLCLNHLFMKKGSKVWRGLASVPSFLTPSHFRMEGCEWQCSCSEHANGWVRETLQPFCPLTLFPSTQKTDPLTIPPQLHPPSLTSELRLNSSSMAYLGCRLEGSDPPDVSICHLPRWFLTVEQRKNAHVSSDIMASWAAAARPLGR